MTIYHFTGIKGSGMSSLAQILFDSGETVQGSDVETYYFTEQPLRERNIKIGLASSTYKFKALRILEHFKLSNFFDFIFN